MTVSDELFSGYLIQYHYYTPAKCRGSAVYNVRSNKLC